MSLTDTLSKKKNQIKRRIPSFAFNYMNKLIELLKTSDIESRALSVGTTLPNGVFLDHKGNEIILSDILQHKKAIVNFYRGSWCPYCNLELKAYTDLLKQYNSENILMIAVSPEKPDITAKKMDLDSLGFTVLSDINNEYAKKVGLVFETTPFLRFLYMFDRISLKRSQGNDFGELPIPATYVVNSDSLITYAWVDVDYTKRAEPAEVLDAYFNI